MLRQSTCLAIIAVIASAIAKPPPTAGGFGSPFAAGGFGAGKTAFPWASFAAGKSAYARSLGPPAAPAVSTITVPFGPKKTSPFFPKFVDPQAMISKKTDMLTNLFSGLGPVNYPLGGVPYNTAAFPNYAPPKPVLYASGEKDDADLQEILGGEKPEKRGLFGPVGPVGPKFGPAGSPFSPFAPKFGPAGVPFSPFAPKFGPGAKFPPFGPFAGFGAKFGGANGIDGSDDGSDDFSTSRKKRSVVGLGPDTPKGPPPAYPYGLGTIPEEPESETPKQYLPGMFGPFGPFTPFAAPAPVVDPSVFISKKTAFLNTLFSNLATSTPLPPGVTPDPLAPKSTIVPADFWLPFNVPTEAAAPVTDAPVTKSTIVPAGFWAPSSIIPGPTEYTEKVNTFLQKLFDSLNLNATSQATDGTEDVSTRVARSVDDIQTISTAKDAIVDSIITELGSIKTDILSTLDDAIAAQKAAPAPKKPTKPGKPVSPWAAMFAPPTVDPTAPFREKISSLSQVFDMLTGLQKNITAAITEAVNSANSAEVTTVAPVADFNAFNVTLLDAIKQKLDSLDKPAAQPVPYPFWGAYPGSAPIKRNVDDEEYYFHDHDNDNRDKRGVKMSMHQGYQSMPPGAVETLSAGGGSTPGHQGGGINLLNSQPFDYQQFADIGKQWADWGQNLNSNQQYDDNNRDNHHHHHSRH